MRPKNHNRIALACLVGGILLTATARGALQLDSVASATMQSLINAGHDGVIAGNARYYDFNYFAAGANPPAASDISVRSNGGNGIDFLGAWGAIDGSFASALISWRVAPLSSGSVDGVWLFSDGLAQVPASGTYASIVQTVRDSNGSTIAGPITSFNDGVLIPTDTTQPDQSEDSLAFAARPEINVITTLQVKSAPGGLATLSYFTTSVNLSGVSASIPEPTTATAGAGVFAFVWMTGRKRAGRKV